jgi:hypothetical protein
MELLATNKKEVSSVWFGAAGFEGVGKNMAIVGATISKRRRISHLARRRVGAV